jgi:hypothetical protein
MKWLLNGDPTRRAVHSHRVEGAREAPLPVRKGGEDRRYCTN